MEQQRDAEYVMHFPPACDAAIAALARETGAEPPEVVRVLALMGLHMRAQMHGQVDVIRECLVELERAAQRGGGQAQAVPLWRLR